MHPDDLQLALVSLSSMQSKDLGSLVELRIQGPDGWRLVEVVARSVSTGLLLSMRDLTGRRRWELARDETARFRSLTQNAMSITMSLDGTGVVSESSGALTRLLGIDQGWLEGRSIADMVTPEDRPALAATLDTVCGSGIGETAGPATVDLGLVDASGTVVPFAITFTNLLDDPTVEGIVATGHDVSDRVRTEQALRTTNSVLAATLESTADGILVVDLDGQVVSCNSTFLEMWRFEGPDVASVADPDLVRVAADELVDPSGFLAKVDELLMNVEAVSHDTIDFLDGRVFERDSRPQRIDGVVVGRVWSFRDMTEHRRLQNELEHQAFHDPLTGLANQALFRDRVTHAADRLARNGGKLAVLFIDLDDFKTVNDSLGHSAGDDLLRTVSERIGSCLRPGDTAARLGGDEFAVLIEELTGPDDAVGIAGRILEVLRVPVELSSSRVSAAASIGIAYGTAFAGVDEILRNADLAMYTAKSAGKNCFRVFAADMHRAAVERLDLENHLRGAAGRGEFEIHYQPIVELETGRITSMEALVRWNHPTRGLLGPLAFIPFAEEGGLIAEIGHHVLVSACHEATEWAALVGAAEAPGVSVNLSPRQLADPALPDHVEQVLVGSGVSPAQLILEITEGALMADPVAATVSLERLSRLGVRLAVDDFGTGYSSLAYLQRFPVDLLKIDGTFVDDHLAEPGWSLAEAIVQISKALGLVPIAEGVENELQAEALRRIGCTHAQGYHLGRPMAGAAARRMILERSGTNHVDLQTARAAG